MSVTSDERRLGGVGRLYGEAVAEQFARTHVVVVGLGGVGSWVVEALARTGIGQFTLIDGDTVDLSNTNRQLPAMDGNYGRYKAEVVSQRITQINPQAVVQICCEFVTTDNVAELLPGGADWVVDCIDDIPAKTALIARAVGLGKGVVTSGGAGARLYPERICQQDLARVKGDPLLGKVRTNLRRDYGFARGSADGRSKLFGVTAVYSDEPLRQPGADSCLAIGADPQARIGFGSSAVVTGSVGLRLASVVLNCIMQGKE